MKTKSRFTIYLVLILLTGVGLALAVPALVKAHASANFDPLSPEAAGDIIYVARAAMARTALAGRQPSPTCRLP